MDLFRPKAPAGSITLEVIKNSDSRLRADKDKAPQQTCGCFTHNYAHVCSQGITK